MHIVIENVRNGKTEHVVLPFAVMADVSDLNAYYASRGFRIVEVKSLAVFC